jgi:hypothetical protein
MTAVGPPGASWRRPGAVWTMVIGKIRRLAAARGESRAIGQARPTRAAPPAPAELGDDRRAWLELLARAGAAGELLRGDVPIVPLPEQPGENPEEQPERG